MTHSLQTMSKTEKMKRPIRCPYAVSTSKRGNPCGSRHAMESLVRLAETSDRCSDGVRRAFGVRSTDNCSLILDENRFGNIRQSPPTSTPEPCKASWHSPSSLGHLRHGVDTSQDDADSYDNAVNFPNAWPRRGARCSRHSNANVTEFVFVRNLQNLNR